MTPPVIFLDFDGVLNHCRATPVSMGSPPGGRGFGDVVWLAAQLDQRMVARVQRVANETGAVVVLSTSWRSAHPFGRLCEMLRRAGLRSPVVGCTPEVGMLASAETGQEYRGRAGEISRWVEWMRPTSWVVLDDYRMTSVPEVDARHVCTDVTIGLTDEDAQLAITILKGRLLK